MTAETRPGRDGTLVLIVEDSPLDARLLQELLDRGADGTIATERAEGWAAARNLLAREHFDLILLDLTLPDSDGLETLSRMQRHSPGIPVVVVTALDDETLARRAIQEGAQDYLVKERLDPALLVRAVQHAIERSRLLTELEARSAALAARETNLRNVVANNVDGMVVVDPDGRILFANPAAAALFGQDSGTLFLAPFPFAAREGRPTEVELMRDGAALAVEIRVMETVWEGQSAKLVALRDVTERHQRERELQAIAAMAGALRAATSRHDMAPVILDHLVDLFGADGVAMVVRDSTSGETTVVLGKGGLAFTTGIIATGGLMADVVATGLPILDEGPEGAAALCDGVYPESQYVCVVPLIVESRVIGALWLCMAAPLKEEERRLLLAITDIASGAVHRAAVMETLEHRVDARTRELAAANERLKELDRLKSKFVSDVSHELRTPVTNLTLYLSLLERGKEEKRDTYLAVLRNQAARLGRLIDDILDLSRLETGALEPTFVEVDVNDIIADVLAVHQARIEQQGLGLEVEPAPDLPLVLGDPAQLTQVLTNLVGNAVNYSTTGFVRVRSGMAAQRVFMSVEDTGIGIPPEDLTHIFDRFYRGQRVGQSGTPGSGLGLSIAREIVERHGGTIVVRSQTGVGSLFTVLLPMAHSRSRVGGGSGP